MTQSWCVRTYREGDEQGILDLMKICGSERVVQQWYWEYKNNPLGHLTVVAEHNGQIIGHMALVPVHMKIGGKVVMGSQAVDLFVHPKFRRQGVFLAIGKELMKEAEKEGIEIVYGFPNKPARSGHLKYDWFDVCNIPLLVKIINKNKSFEFFERNSIIGFLSRHKTSKGALKFILMKTFAISDFLSRMFNRIEKKGSIRNGKIQTIETFDDRIDSFFERVSNNYPAIVIRNKKYLNWRYFDKPNAKYTVFLAEENERILGYIVLRSKYEKNLKVGYIVDLLASFDEKNAIHVLVSKALEHFKIENVDLIICWMLKNSSTMPYYGILRYNGFTRISSNPLIARVNSSDTSRKFLENSAKWYIAIGDSDHV